MTPANFPDLRSIVNLNYKDHSGKQSFDRKFSMVLSTPFGTLLQTIPGVGKTSGGKVM